MKFIRITVFQTLRSLMFQLFVNLYVYRVRKHLLSINPYSLNELHPAIDNIDTYTLDGEECVLINDQETN